MTINLARMQSASRGGQFRAVRLHGADPAMLDPFMGIDHAWMSAPTFPPHPHAGFSAVTYLFQDSETDIDNRDSLGNSVMVKPGGLHWTAAGRGVVHREDPAVLGRTAHLLQIFINLPQTRQNDAPFSLTLAPQEVPVVQLPGVTVRVPLGSFGEQHSPLAPPTDVTLLDVFVQDGASFTLPVAAGQRAFIMPIAGSADIDGQPFGLEELAAPVLAPFDSDASYQLRARAGATRLAIFIGQPLHQPVLSNGPMAFADAQSLTAAAAAYHCGEMGKL